MVVATRNKNTKKKIDETVYDSQWNLIKRKFAKHKLAVGSLYLLIILYCLAFFADFMVPYTANWKDLDHAYCPPQTILFNMEHGFFTKAIKRHTDPVSLRKNYEEDANDIIPLSFFVKGEPYKVFRMISGERHFFGVDLEKYKKLNPDYNPDIKNSFLPTFYFIGADKYGRDLFSRIIHGARVSLSVGLIGIIFTFILGLTIGGISGYLGGKTDIIIQRSIEIIQSFPQLPLWLGLAAAMPDEWSSLQIYFGITVALSLLNWCGLARVVRAKVLSLREEDYAVAAKLLGAGHSRIIFRHLLPGFTSHIIVSLTLSVPGTILGETSLSFLGLGLRPPVVSWGVLLQDCMNMQAIAHYPWLLMPAFFVVLVVLSFNFLGDGLRDAADPYASR
jgi:peptide/nickel transport system permease protein